MKKLFSALFALFFTFSFLTCRLSAEKTLVSESACIRNREGLYWEFTVPYGSKAVKIDCSTSAESSWKMTFAVLSEFNEVSSFINEKKLQIYRRNIKRKCSELRYHFEGFNTW